MIKGKLEGKPIFAPDGGYVVFISCVELDTCMEAKYLFSFLPLLLASLNWVTVGGSWNLPPQNGVQFFYRGNCKPSVVSDGFLSLRCYVVVNVAS